MNPIVVSRRIHGISLGSLPGGLGAALRTCMANMWHILWPVLWLAGAAPTSGELRGRVSDETGAALPGVAIALTLDTGSTRTVYTDPPGNTSFRPCRRDGINCASRS